MEYSICDNREQESSQILNKLRDMLKQYDKLILIRCHETVNEDIISKLQSLKVTGNDVQKILVLSTVKQQVYPNFYYQEVSEEDSKIIYCLYHMYEFSDRFLVISSEEQYGSLFNFIDTGLLTVEEALQVILH